LTPPNEKNKKYKPKKGKAKKGKKKKHKGRKKKEKFEFMEDNEIEAKLISIQNFDPINYENHINSPRT